MKAKFIVAALALMVSVGAVAAQNTNKEKAPVKKECCDKKKACDKKADKKADCSKDKKAECCKKK